VEEDREGRGQEAEAGRDLHREEPVGHAFFWASAATADLEVMSGLVIGLLLS
jgi:hypothetical protein